MKTISRLEKFLINRGLLEKFKFNLKQYYSHYSNLNILIGNEPIDNLIMSSFNWASSPEGREFWRRLHREWNRCLDENTL